MTLFKISNKTRHRVLPRNSILLVNKSGYGRLINQGVLGKTVEIADGASLYVDDFNFYTNTVIVKYNNLQISVDFEFIMNNTVDNMNRGQIVSALCITENTDTVVTIEHFAGAMLVFAGSMIVAFALGMSMMRLIIG